MVNESTAHGKNGENTNKELKRTTVVGQEDVDGGEGRGRGLEWKNGRSKEGIARMFTGERKCQAARVENKKENLKTEKRDRQKICLFN